MGVHDGERMLLLFLCGGRHGDVSRVVCRAEACVLAYADIVVYEDVDHFWQCGQRGKEGGGSLYVVIVCIDSRYEWYAYPERVGELADKAYAFKYAFIGHASVQTVARRVHHLEVDEEELTSFGCAAYVRLRGEEGSVDGAVEVSVAEFVKDSAEIVRMEQWFAAA